MEKKDVRLEEDLSKILQLSMILEEQELQDDDFERVAGNEGLCSNSHLD